MPKGKGYGVQLGSNKANIISFHKTKPQAQKAKTAKMAERRRNAPASFVKKMKPLKVVPL